MFNGLGMNMGNLSRLSNAVTRSISAENFTGEKGKGGMATEGTGAACARDLGQGWKVSPSIRMEPNKVYEIANIEGPGAIQHIWMSGPSYCRFIILRFYWDDNEYPSVEVPMGDFFGDAYTAATASINSLAVCRTPKTGMNCYWEMPFRKKCRITAQNINDGDQYLYYQVTYTLTDVPEDCAYFHAQFRRTNPLPYKENYTIVDNIKGKGQYVGTYMAWGVNSSGWWGEGEIKFYMDGDKEFPTICGTGTEDYFGGSYNFDIGGKYQEFTTPYSGMMCYRPDGLYNSQTRFSLYRWHIMDPIRFENDLKVTIQALGWRCGGRYLPMKDDMASVAFWYQTMPFNKFPEFPSRDELEIC